MAAISPTFEAVKAAPTRPNRAAASGPATAHAPDVGLPLRFVLTGLLCLLIGVAWLVARPNVLATYHYNQYTVAVTHLFTLGFITSILMGALYQLVPVALETPLHSERLAKWQFVFHLVGVSGMVWMFWVWNLKQVGHFGSVFACGVGLFVYNLARTLWRIPRWNVVAGGVVSALVWLSLVVVVGLAMAAAKCTYESATRLDPHTFTGALVHFLQQTGRSAGKFDAIALMHAHAHLGVIGLFVMMIVSVSYKLVPMFVLSQVQNEARAWWSVGLLNAGLAGLFPTMVLKSPWKLGFALVIVAALVLYGCEMAAILHARKRGALDWGLRYFLTAISLLAPLAGLGVVLGWPGLRPTLLTTQLETVYGLIALLGVVGLSILGFLYKIVPFLVWFHSYSPQIGRCRVPSLADLYSTRVQALGYWLYLAGLGAVAVATAAGAEGAVRWSALLLLASLLVFAANLGLILRHFFRPQLALPNLRPATGGEA